MTAGFRQATFSSRWLSRRLSLASDFSVERRARTWKLLVDMTFSKPTVMKLVGGGLNDGGAVAAAKIIFIVLSEKSDFWVEEFPKKVISALIASMKHLKMKMPFQLTKIHLKDRCWRRL